MARAKRIVGDRIARILEGVGWLARRRTPDRLTVLTFHRVLPDALRRAYPLPGLAVTPEALSWMLGRLREHYACGTLAEAFAQWRDPNPGMRPPLAITFDDCTADGFEYARAALSALDLRASFFAPAGLIEDREALWHDRLGFAVASLVAAGAPTLRDWLAEHRLHVRGADPARSVVAAAKRVAPTERARWVAELERFAGGRQDPAWARLMDWEEIGTLVADGHEIGSHAMSHELLPQLEPDAMRAEVERSRSLLRERIGQPVESFCYPNGDHDAATVAAVQAAGYRAAVTTAGGLNEADQDALRLRRFDMQLEYVTDGRGVASESLLLFRVSGLHPAARAG